MLGASLSAKLEGIPLDTSLDSIKVEPGLLNVLARTASEGQIGVQGGVPTSKEAALDASVLGQPCLSDSLHSECIFFKARGQRVLASAGVVLVQHLAARQAGTGDGMVEGFGLGLCARGCHKRRLGLRWRCSGGEEMNLLADSTSEILERLLDVRWVVVGFVGVLRTAGDAVSRLRSVEARQACHSRNSQHLLMSLLQGIDSLLEVDVLGGKLGL